MEQKELNFHASHINTH